ncbi:nuclear transport factor 2 family protein [Chitinophaga sp. OAE865]|uniref:nuclear transport factor 2 family protein n=1 Tax=Chitinophaga sp. OAE865 TaxID=2817898 RepID=UPI001AE5A450
MENFEATVAGFHRLISEGKFLEALDKYYDENISSSDNDGPAIKGLEAMRKAVSGFLGNTTDLKIALKNSMVIKGYSVAEWHYQFMHPKMGKLNYQQISVAHWKNGKIIKEQHLYSL